MGLQKTQEREYARMLYVGEHITFKEISERVGVTEKTISKWAEADKWNKLKVSLMTTKNTQIVKLYEQLEALMQDISTRPIVYDVPPVLLKPIKLKDEHGCEFLEFPKYDPKEYPIKIGNVPNSKDADILAKITTSIERLEIETNLGEYIEVGRKVLVFVQDIDLEHAKLLKGYFDEFINSKLKHS